MVSSWGGIAWLHENDPNAVGWVTPFQWYNEFIDPPRYNTEAIICNTDTTPAPKHITIAAGETVTAQWDNWPESHRGPIITYLADCNGPCDKVDKKNLKFFKIAQAGLLKDIPSDQPDTGRWATDDLRDNGSKWDIQIPSDLAAGFYTLRTEIIALQEAIRSGNAQNYPRCFNLEVTGGGSSRPAGVVGTSLYQPGHPGLTADILQPIPGGYQMPGPEFNGQGSSSALQSQERASGSSASPAPSASTSTSTSTSAVASGSTEPTAEPNASNTGSGDAADSPPSEGPESSPNAAEDPTEQAPENNSAKTDTEDDNAPQFAEDQLQRKSVETEGATETSPTETSADGEEEVAAQPVNEEQPAEAKTGGVGKESCHESKNRRRRRHARALS